MIGLKFLTKAKSVHKCHKNWIDTPNSGYKSRIDVGQRRKVHSEVSHVLYHKISDAEKYKSEQVSLVQHALDYYVLIEPE